VVNPETQHLNTEAVAQVAQDPAAVPAAADIQEFLRALAQVLHLSSQVVVAAQLHTRRSLLLAQQVAVGELVMVVQQQTLHHLVALAQQPLVEQLQQVKVLHAFPLQAHLCKVAMVVD
jgi:hypothetical protein